MFLSTYYNVFYRRFVMIGSCILTIGLFIGFYIGSLDNKILSDKVIISNLVRQYAIGMKS